MMQEEPIIQKKTGNVVRVRKPEWLKIRLGDNSTFTDTKHTIEHHGLNTICHSGRCPQPRGVLERWHSDLYDRRCCLYARLPLL